MVLDDFDGDRGVEGTEPEVFQDPEDQAELNDATEQDDTRDLDFSFDEPDDDFENFISRTYVCEDCDFRWAEKIYPERNDYPDYDDEMGRAHICPMCGSMNVSFY